MQLSVGWKKKRDKKGVLRKREKKRKLKLPRPVGEQSMAPTLMHDKKECISQLLACWRKIGHGDIHG